MSRSTAFRVPFPSSIFHLPHPGFCFSLGVAGELGVVALADGRLEGPNLVVLLEGDGDLDRPRAVRQRMEAHFHLPHK